MAQHSSQWWVLIVELCCSEGGAVPVVFRNIKILSGIETTMRTHRCQWDEPIAGRVLKYDERSGRYHVNCPSKKKKQLVRVGNRVSGTKAKTPEQQKKFGMVYTRRGMAAIPRCMDDVTLEDNIGWLATRGPPGLLVDHLDDVDDDGWTALHHAASGGCIDHVRVILDHDQSLCHQGDKLLGSTPLHLAVNGQYVDVVDLLLQKGADPTKPDNFGHSSQDIAPPPHYSIRAEAVHRLLHRSSSTKDDDYDDDDFS